MWTDSVRGVQCLIAVVTVAVWGLTADPAQAAQIAWDTTKTGIQNWSTGANWVGGQVPTNTDDVFFGAVATATTVGDIYNFQSLTATNTGGGDLTFNLARNVATTNGGGIRLVSGTYAVNFNGQGRNLDLGSGSLLLQGSAGKTTRMSPGNGAHVQLVARGGIVCTNAIGPFYALLQTDPRAGSALDVHGDVTLENHSRIQRYTSTTIGAVNFHSNVTVRGTSGAYYYVGRSDATAVSTDRVDRAFSLSGGIVTLYDNAVLRVGEASLNGGTFTFADNPNFQAGQLRVDGTLTVGGVALQNAGTHAIVEVGGRLTLSNAPAIYLTPANEVRLSGGLSIVSTNLAWSTRLTNVNLVARGPSLQTFECAVGTNLVSSPFVFRSLALTNASVELADQSDNVAAVAGESFVVGSLTNFGYSVLRLQRHAFWYGHPVPTRLLPGTYTCFGGTLAVPIVGTLITIR